MMTPRAASAAPSSRCTSRDAEPGASQRQQGQRQPGQRQPSQQRSHRALSDARFPSTLRESMPSLDALSDPIVWPESRSTSGGKL